MAKLKAGTVDRFLGLNTCSIADCFLLVLLYFDEPLG